MLKHWGITALQGFKMLIPALIPSWRFFESIAPAPLIEYSYLENANDQPKKWEKLNKRPTHISLLKKVKGLFWNPEWNQALYLNACAERMVYEPNEHVKAHIVKALPKTDKPYIAFRLMFNDKGQNHILYSSEALNFQKSK